MKLYGYWRSSATWRVRIALGLKGLAYDYQPVHLIKDGGEQHGDEYKRVNAMEQVPTLEIAEGERVHRLSQSIAILELLEERWPEPPLLPKGPWLRARVRQMTELVNAGIQPLQNLTVMRHVKDLGADDRAWARHYIERGLRVLEGLGAETAGDFLVGEAPTFADVVLVPQLYASRRFGVDIARFPLLARVEAHCAALPAFAAAHADKQSDAQP